MSAALAAVFARWRTAEGTHYTTAGDRFNPPGMDCSGGIGYANRPFVPHLSRPGNTATFAQWAVRERLTKPLSRRQPGDLVIYDRYGQPTRSYGARGHVGQISEDVNVTWECASSRGCQRYRYSRLGWSMCIDLGQWLRARGAPTTTPSETRPTEDDMILIGTSDGKHHLIGPGGACDVTPATYLKLAATGSSHAEDVHPLEFIGMLKGLAGIDLST